MNINSFQSSYASSVSASQQYVALNNIPTQQLSDQELAQYATESRAKRLNGLLSYLSDALDEAVAGVQDPLQAATAYDDYMYYVLARLQGDESEPIPTSLEGFNEELEGLVDDILRAWDALIAAGDIARKDTTKASFKSVNGVLVILERIAERRIKSMLLNHLYLQWRLIYRDNIPGKKEADAFVSESMGSLPEGVSLSEADSTLRNSNNNGRYLLKLLSDARDLNDSEQNPVFNEKTLAKIESILNTFPSLA